MAKKKEEAVQDQVQEQTAETAAPARQLTRE